nr:MAG TPA: hypothetical protein [Caudoviricetes sp.]
MTKARDRAGFFFRSVSRFESARQRRHNVNGRPFEFSCSFCEDLCASRSVSFDSCQLSHIRLLLTQLTFNLCFAHPFLSAVKSQNIIRQASRDCRIAHQFVNHLPAKHASRVVFNLHDFAFDVCRRQNVNDLAILDYLATFERELKSDRKACFLAHGSNLVMHCEIGLRCVMFSLRFAQSLEHSHADRSVNVFRHLNTFVTTIETGVDLCADVVQCANCVVNCLGLGFGQNVGHFGYLR